MGELDVAPPPVGATDSGGRPSRHRGPSLRPALVVLGVALVIVLLFGIGSVLTGSGGSTGGGGSGRSVPVGPTAVAGTTLEAVPAATALDPIRQPGTPPANIVDSLALPVGATRVAHSRSRSITLFDADERFTVPGTQAAVIGFYRSELAAMRWKLTSVGPARGRFGATEVLAEKAGTDGWYWEVGVVVSPTVYPSGGSTPAGTTPFELRLFQVNDAS